MGKAGMAIVFLLVVAVLTAGVLYFVNSNANNVINPSNSNGAANASASGTTPTSGQTVSDGAITVAIPADFGLATNQQQVLVRSYIPSCDPTFTYCLYYNGTAYQGTNFDSAGIRIAKRTDLATTNACLTAPPPGYTDFTPTSTTASDYSLSEFTPLGNAGAGHLAVGTLYRLSFNNDCYEFETRIGQSQFANYPSGTIKEFTQNDQANLQNEIRNILNNVALSSGEHVTFPQ